MSSTPRLEIKALTSLRAFAAGMVLLHHFLFQAPYPNARQNPFEAIAVEGHIGVTIFFVLSGFLITSRYYKPMTEKRLGWFDYLSKRVARIWPLYLAVLILTLLFEQVQLVPLVHLTLTQGYFFNLRFSGVPTAWSLSVEETYYLIAPVAFMTQAWAGSVFAGKALRTALGRVSVLAGWVIALAAIGLGLAAVAQSFPLDFLSGLMRFDWPQLRVLTIFGRFFDFAVGIACALLYESGRVMRWFERPRGPFVADGLSILSVAGIGVCCLWINGAGGAYGPGWVYNYPVSILTGLWIVALTCTTSWVSRLMGLAPFVYLGRISYATYLLQFLVFHLIVQPLIDVSSAFYMPMLFAIMIAASAIAYEVVERPAQRAVLRLAQLIKQRMRRSEPAPVTSPK